MRVYLLFLILISFLPEKIFSQQTPLYSQYMMNGFTFNSAMAGYDGFTAFNLNSRQQWLGLDNAPRTFSFTAQTRLLKRSYMIKVRPQRSNRFIPARSGRIGLGVEIFNDRNGYFGQSGISLNYAYHISFTNAQLSLGLATSLVQFKADKSGFIFRDNSIEPKLIGLDQPTYIPDVNVGLFYVNREFMGGFSVANIMQSKVKFGNTNLSAYQIKRQYYIVGGYKYSDMVRFTYEPSFLIKTTEAFFPQLDMSFKVTYLDHYWGGFSYRTLNTAVVFIGVKKNSFIAGYAFDFDFNAFQRFTYGSHELTLALKFGDSAKRYRWVNRY